MKRIICLFLTLFLVLTFFAGCGQTDTAEGPSGTPSGTPSATPGETPDVRNDFKIAHHGEVPSLDTHYALNDNAMRLMANIYDPLIRMNHKYEPIPGVAESWEFSDDGSEVTFYIKEGVKFHNGDELTIADVVFSVERGMASPQASPSFSRVTGVEAVGNNAVKLTLVGPDAHILLALALPVAGIVSEKAVNEFGDDYGRNPVGTGPYKLANWDTSEKVVLEAFENYHQGVALIKRVEFITITDKSSAIIALETGDIDAYVNVNASDFQRVEDHPDLALHRGESFGYHYLVLNTTKAPFDDVNVRRALAHAVDKEAILFGLEYGNGMLIDQFITEGMTGYTDKVQKYPYDLAKSQDLLAEAGYADGFDTTIYVHNEYYATFAQVVQNSLREIGVTAEIRILERAAFDVAGEGGEHDIMIYGATFSAPSVDAATYNPFHTGGIGVRNYSLYSNPAFDLLLDTARTTIDPSELQNLHSEALIILSEDVPAVPIMWRGVNLATSSDLKNVYTNPYSFYNVFDFSW